METDKWQHVKGDNPEYIKFKEFLVNGQEQAVKKGTASNISVAYPVDKQPNKY